MSEFVIYLCTVNSVWLVNFDYLFTYFNKFQISWIFFNDYTDKGMRTVKSVWSVNIDYLVTYLGLRLTLCFTTI